MLGGVAGAHGEGAESVPYFAMEYIVGARTLTDYAREKKLGTRKTKGAARVKTKTITQVRKGKGSGGARRTASARPPHGLRRGRRSKSSNPTVR